MKYNPLKYKCSVDLFTNIKKPGNSFALNPDPSRSSIIVDSSEISSSLIVYLAHEYNNKYIDKIY